MLQELFVQVNTVWVVLVLVAAFLIVAWSVYFLVRQILVFRKLTRRFSGFSEEVDELPGCRIENIELVKGIATERTNTAFQTIFEKMSVDCETVYNGLWVPQPDSRLTMPDILEPASRVLGKKSYGFAVLLAGIAISTMAFSSAYILGNALGDSSVVRFFAISPFILSGLGMLILHQVNETLAKRIEHSWKNMMIVLERKIPVYSITTETSRLIIQMKEYDAHMAKSVNEVAHQLHALTTSRMAEAVSNAVKYVMSATVGPAVVKSSDTLAIVAKEISNKLQQMDIHVAKLYTELESRQDKQSELWFDRYQEIADTLSYQQETMLKSLSGNVEAMVDELARSQKLSIEKLTGEQSRVLNHVESINMGAWSQLQEKLTSIISQLAESQDKLLNGLQRDQITTLSLISETSEKSSTLLQDRIETLLGTVNKSLSDLWEQSNKKQGEVFENITQAQQDGLKQMREQQSEAMALLSENQKASLSEIDARQSETLKHINENQSGALTSIAQNQAKAIDDFRQAQFDALAESASRQQETLQQLAENFGEAVSSKLSGYLDPITSRLHDASEALIKAQNYASDVQDVLRMQNEAATELQSSIGELFKQLIETRKTMSEDLTSLKASSGVMSKAAEIMGSVYEGSQAGLSEAISQMSNDLMRLSNVLSNVMSGSAEQTQKMQEQSMQVYEANQKHLDSVKDQITFLSDELSTRIDQLMLGFSNLTEDLIKSVNSSINEQNDSLGGNLRSLTDIMSEEARSMSLFAQQITMDIETLNESLKGAVGEFDQGMRTELTGLLTEFDSEVADIVKRLARSATELGDAVEALPVAMRQIGQSNGTLS